MTISTSSSEKEVTMNENMNKTQTPKVSPTWNLEEATETDLT